MANIIGTRTQLAYGTGGSQVTQTDLDKEVASMLKHWDMDKSFLTLLTSGLDSKGKNSLQGKSLKSRDWSWHERTRRDRWAANDSTQLTHATTTINVTTDSGEQFNVGDVIQCMNPTSGETANFQVTAITNDALTVIFIRASDATPTTYSGPVAGLDPIVILGNNSVENSSPPAAISTVKAKRYNVTSTIRTTANISRWLQDSAHYSGGNPMTEESKGALVDHLISCESHILFSKISAAHVAGFDDGALEGYHTYTSGVVEQILGQSGVEEDLDGEVLKYMDFVAWFGEVTRYGGNKLLLVPEDFLNAMAAWAEQIGQLKFDGSTKIYGVGPFHKLVTPHGTALLKRHGLLTDEYAQTVICLDLNNFKVRAFNKTRMRAQKDIGTKGVDGRTDGYISDIGVELSVGPSHGILHGWDGYVEEVI